MVRIGYTYALLHIDQTPMTLRRDEEVHVLVHVVVDKTFLSGDLWLREASEEIRRCKSQLYLGKVHADADCWQGNVSGSWWRECVVSTYCANRRRKA